MPIEGVLLDVNQTLFSLSGLQPVFARLGLGPQHLRLWATSVLRDGFALATAGHYRPFSEVAYAALIGLDPDHLHAQHAQSVLDALYTVEPHTDAADGLRKLWVAGVKIMTLTTIETEPCEELFRRTGLAGYVDRFLSTAAIQCWKPAPASYRYGLEQLGLPPERVALISAHSWDIHGAHHAGLCTVWLARYEKQPGPIFAAPDIQARTLPDATEQLLAWHAVEAL